MLLFRTFPPLGCERSLRFSGPCILFRFRSVTFYDSKPLPNPIFLSWIVKLLNHKEVHIFSQPVGPYVFVLSPHPNIIANSSVSTSPLVNDHFPRCSSPMNNQSTRKGTDWHLLMSPHTRTLSDSLPFPRSLAFSDRQTIVPYYQQVSDQYIQPRCLSDSLAFALSLTHSDSIKE